MVLTTYSVTETEDLGRRIGRVFLEQGPFLPKAAVLNLEGDLGGGKTSFVRGLAEGLEVAGPITSPTFVLSRRYPLEKGLFRNFYHLDLYRLSGRRKEPSIDLEEISGRPDHIAAIEWSERLGRRKPEGLDLFFVFRDENTRKIRIRGNDDWSNIIQQATNESAAA